jgi:hypothetical protein
MTLWIVSSLLGMLTVAFAPALLIFLVKFLSSIGRKFPSIANAIAILTALLIGAYLIVVIFIFATFYHKVLI